MWFCSILCRKKGKVIEEFVRGVSFLFIEVSVYPVENGAEWRKNDGADDGENSVQ